MIARAFALFLLLVFSGSAFAAEDITIIYLGVEDDPYYEPQHAYTGLSLRDRQRPVEGARLGLRGTKVLGRALGVKFKLEELILPSGDVAVEAVTKAREAEVTALLLDLPEAQMQQVLSAGFDDVLLFNIRHRGDQWRADHCAVNLLHTMPSQAMLTDAMAQHLKFQNWPRILLLKGDAPSDEAEALAVEASARKFGLSIEAQLSFQLTNDPRRRDLSNIRLMTSDADYDVIWLVDSKGEFGRYVPFATAKPRPIVGSEGLIAHAWHWTLERYGAPQLNQRFRRKAKRNMSSEDWAAWAAVSSIAAAVTKAGKADREAILSAIRGPELILDLYKGLRGSFRSWNGQLRQPVLLATHNAVIAIAPLDGFDHQKDQQDTLGVDERENACVPPVK